MKAVILAAGTASRLRPLTDDRPKCLLEIGGKAMLGRALETLISRGISGAVLVTGYRGEMIRRFVGESFPGLPVEFIVNPRFATTNNIYSLWSARSAVAGQGMILLDSDIVFDGRLIDLILGSEHEDCLAVKRGVSLGVEEVKVRVDGDRRVLGIGKEISPVDAWGESIGIERFGQTFVQMLFEELDRLIEQEHRTELFYEAAFQRVIDRGRLPVAIDAGSLPCLEVDTPEDLERARTLVGDLP